MSAESSPAAASDAPAPAQKPKPKGRTAPAEPPGVKPAFKPRGPIKGRPSALDVAREAAAHRNGTEA